MLRPLLRHIGLSLAIGLVLTPFSVRAHPHAQQLVHAGATMQAVAEACDHYSADELEGIRAQQRAATAAMGVSGEQFDEMFDAGYKAARTKIAAASPAERSQMCEKMKKMSLGG